MKTLFIADLHLSADRPDITSLFFQFLNSDARDADALYILGDLFEMWIGDDDQNELNCDVARHIKQLADTGIPVYFIHGNRDFLLGKRFARQSGMQLLPESDIITLYGQRILIMHGDSLCTLDTDYQAFRKKSRRRWWQVMMLSLPLWLRRRIAAKARVQSQQNNSSKTMEIMDVTQSEVVEQMQLAGVERLIHGHTHRPDIHQFDIECNGTHTQGERIVLGDWYTQGSLLTVTPQGYELEQRPLPAL